MPRRAIPAAAPRPLAAIRADIIALVDELIACASTGGATTSGTMTNDDVLSLAQAAHAAGWSISTTRRHLLRRKETHPTDPLGRQPGGLRLTRWSVPRDRWLRYLRDLPRADRDGTDDTCTGTGGPA